jgi:hypothetical protein
MILALASNSYGQKVAACAAYDDGSYDVFNESYLLIEGLGPLYVSSMGIKLVNPNGGMLSFVHDYRLAWNLKIEDEMALGLQLNQGLLFGARYRNFKPYVGVSEMITLNPGQLKGKYDWYPMDSQPSAYVFTGSLDLGFTYQFMTDLFTISPEVNYNFFSTHNRMDSMGAKYWRTEPKTSFSFGVELAYWFY